jgi:hypothetical protein
MVPVPLWLMEDCTVQYQKLLLDARGLRGDAKDVSNGARYVHV